MDKTLPCACIFQVLNNVASVAVEVDGPAGLTLPQGGSMQVGCACQRQLLLDLAVAALA